MPISNLFYGHALMRGGIADGMSSRTTSGTRRLTRDMPFD